MEGEKRMYFQKVVRENLRKERRENEAFKKFMSFSKRQEAFDRLNKDNLKREIE